MKNKRFWLKIPVIMLLFGMMVVGCDEYTTQLDTRKIATLNSVTADGSNWENTSALILTFSKAIDGLSENDITLSGLSGVSKGTLSGSGPVYTLPVSGFTSGCTLGVQVDKTGYVINESSKQLHINYKVATLNSVTANGSNSQTTTTLTLTFNEAIDQLSANDITLSGLSGVSKGTLNGSGPVYTLPISGFISNGNLTVSVNKAGYSINSNKTVAIYFLPVTWTAVANTTFENSGDGYIEGIAWGNRCLAVPRPDAHRGCCDGAHAG
jgi:hypothetical protein